MDQEEQSSHTSEQVKHLKPDGKGGYVSSNIIFDPKSKKAVLNIEKKKNTVCLMPPPNALPIILVPTYMGTNVQSSKKGYEDINIWNMDDRSKAASLWKDRGPADRKNMLDPTYLYVDHQGQLPSESEDLSHTEMKRRGWGDVSYFMYGEFLKWLNNEMNDFVVADLFGGTRYFMTDKVKYGNWEWFKDVGKEFGVDIIENKINSGLEKYHMETKLPRFSNQKPEGLSFSDSQDIKDELDMTIDEWADSYDYVYPVYAFGYNWMESQIDTAIKLGKMIEDVLAYEGHLHSGKVEKVILVTHGSGGIIARYCAKKNEEKIANIIHVAMPTTGLPEVYRRLKIGSVLPKNIYHAEATADHLDEVSYREYWTGESKDIKISAKGMNIPEQMAKVYTGATYENYMKHSSNSAQELDEDSVIDGQQAEDVAAMSAESTGYLQILPFKGYGLTRYSGVPTMQSQWLHIYSKNHFFLPSKKTQNLPVSDPYSEIYLSDHSWALYDQKTMNPDGQDSSLFTDKLIFIRNINKYVRSFQDYLENPNRYFHPVTFNIYGKTYDRLPNVPLATAVTNNQYFENDIGAIDGDGVVPTISNEDIPTGQTKGRLYIRFRHRNAFLNKKTQLSIVWCIVKTINFLEKPIY